MRLCGAAAAALVLGSGHGAAAQSADPELIRTSAPGDLSRLSLEELAALPVTSVSKRAEPISEAPASVFLITQERIRRSGSRSIPEILRTAPQLEVAQIDSTDYSITARGFGGFESAEKLLVLIDGRSVYTPLFSGVDWDQHHVLIEDLDRIEVVSGPGGTLWGANAVNGVVNITSRSAFDTMGPLVSASLGDRDRDVSARFGAAIGPDAAFRVYGLALERGESETVTGADRGDSWDTIQGGFRFDWRREAAALTLQGDVHDGNLDNSVGLPGYIRGHNLLGRWTYESARGALQIQAYYDHFSREARLIHDELDTYDVQIQQSVRLGGHHLVLGGGYRRMEDDFRTLSEPQLLSPPQRRTYIANAFLQDEITLRPDLSLILGLKLEHNSYTETELLPNVRLAWRASERQFVWAAVSRAIRDPSRIERDFQIPNFVVPGQMGSEKLVAYEVGYRGRLGQVGDLSLTAFWHDYDDIRTNEFSVGTPRVLYVGNSIKGATYGLEGWGEVDLTSWWRLGAGVTLLGRDFETKRGVVDQARFRGTGADPDYYAKLRSEMRLRPNLDLDVALRAYGEIKDAPHVNLVSVPPYVEANARLAWRPRDDLELALVGENLLSNRHLESIERRRAYMPRRVAVTLRWAP